MKNKISELQKAKYGRLCVLKESTPYIFKNGKKGRQAECICDCGNKIITTLQRLINGQTKSCGCFKLEQCVKGGMKGKTHGMTGKDVYNSWNSMMYRCYNKKAKSYYRYGGRGIKVCDRWKKFENFYKDMGERPSGRSIDRIDNNRNYELNNCKWSTEKEQQRNRGDNVKYKGETSTEASSRLGGGHTLVCLRILRGWSKKRAFSTPVKR